MPEQAAVKSALSAEDATVNFAMSYVNYGYDTPYYQVENTSTSNMRKKIGIKRDGQVVILNKQTLHLNATLTIRLSGDVGVAANNSEIDAWANGISLATGHEYLVVMKLISGSSTAGEESQTPLIGVYEAGGHTNVGTGDRPDSTTATRIFTAENGKEYNICVRFTDDTYTFTNAKLLIVVEDLTESAIEKIHNSIADANADIVSIKEEVDYLSEDMAQITNPTEYDFSEIGNETYPTGWRNAYYSSETGSLNYPSGYYLATINKITFSANVSHIYAEAPDGYGIRVSEFNTSDELVKNYGSALGETLTQKVRVPITSGNKYGFTIGRFENSNSSDYNNETFLADVHIIMVHDTIDDIYKTMDAMTVSADYDWTELGTTTYPTGWRNAYYKSDTGELVTSGFYLATNSGLTFSRNTLSITAKAPDGYGIRIYEYDSAGTYLGKYGNNGKTGKTQEVKINPVEGHVYKFSIGRFANQDASDYNNETFLAGVSLTIELLKTGVENKKGRTGDFEFFTVNVSRPLSLGGEEIETEEETIECVLRLPTTYSMTGSPTRLVLACHGAHGYINSATNTWYNSDWKTFMDALLAAGYAVFDANVLPLSAGVSPDNVAGYALGSPLYVNVLKKAYDYITANYNVTKQIFAHGTSMGGVGATAFSHAYPELVLAESSFAGRDFIRYLPAIADGTVEDRFALAYGYDTAADLIADKFSHAEGCFPSLSLVKCKTVSELKITIGEDSYPVLNNDDTAFSELAIAPPPDRESDFSGWLAYYTAIGNLGRNDDAGIWMGKRTVPYKAWNSWVDNPGATKLEEILAKAYNTGNACPYYTVAYETGTHTEMSYGQINDMIPQLIAWYKRWE
jgi:hypothetical protein